MKVYDVNYKVNSIDNANYVVLADFHGDFNVDLAKYLRNNPAKYIIIAGDLMNGNQWNNKTKLKELRRFIDIIKENHNVIIGLGNHDLWRIDDEGMNNYKRLECHNVTPLYNNYCIINNNMFSNLLPDKKAFSYLKQHDDKTVEKILKTYNDNLVRPREGYINHLISHNPYHFNHRETINKISYGYDVIETGHFHDGWILTSYLDKNYDSCLDKGVQELIKNKIYDTKTDELSVMPRRNLSRGIVYNYSYGYYLLLPDNNVYYYDKSLNKYKISSKKELNNSLKNNKVPALVITGAVNTFAKLRMFYPYITNLELTKENEYEGKSLIKTI